MARRSATPGAEATVVIATRNRRGRLLATLDRLVDAHGSTPTIVVDNASTDGTPAAVRRRHPGVRVIVMEGDVGSAARTVGARTAETELVAFSDDDSWWAPGALGKAATRFRRYPRLGLLAARIVVEPGGRCDPTCAEMANSPLPPDMPLPGPPVLGFVACGAIVRRSAYLECGGFHPRFGFGAEEQLLAIDLAAAGWGLAYADDVVAHHEPARGGRPGRDARVVRNLLWSAWLRRPLPKAVGLTLELARRRDRRGMRAFAAALGGLGWVARERRVVPPRVERALTLLAEAQATP